MERLLHGKLHGGNNGDKNQLPLTGYRRWVVLSALILLVTVAPAVAPAPPLVVAFTGTPTTGDIPLAVSFTDSSPSSPTGWAWYFGDENYTTPWTEVNTSAEWTARDMHSSVVLPNGTIVLIGGSTHIEAKNDVWGSMDKGVTWTQVNASTGWPVRYGQSSVVLPDGSIVLMSGNNGGSFYNDVWRSTDKGATWIQQTASAGWTGRFAPCTVAMPDGSIVLMGGQNSTRYTNETWRSTDQGATWTLVNASAGWSPRQLFSSVVMPDSSIVLMGGDGNSGLYLNDVWRSTDQGMTWTLMNASAGWTGRYGQSSVAMPDGSIVLLGGYPYTNDVWRSTDYGVTWTPVNMSAGWSPRQLFSSVVMPDGSIVLMGGGNNTAAFNDVWRFVPIGSSVKNPTHTYTKQGRYQVALQISNVNGFNSTRKASYITANIARPNVTAISPASGPTAGGTLVTLTGSGFTGATAVRFGTMAGTSRTVVSASKITVRSPAHAAGTVYVTVTTPGGTSATSPADRFRYAVRPNVTSIAPKSGPLTGNTLVTISGTGFTGATAVRFGTTKNTTPLTVVSATKITVRSPAHGAGATDVTVTTPGGTSATSPADRFTYASRPNVTSIAPKSGPVTGNTLVTMTGTGFTGATTVKFGPTKNTTPLTVVSATKITVRSPAHTAGVVNVFVTTPGGTSAVSTADRFTYR